MEVIDERPRTWADDLWGPGMQAGLQEGRTGSVGPGPPLAKPQTGNSPRVRQQENRAVS